MTKVKESSLALAAEALDRELRAFDDLAREAKRGAINTDKAVSRVARALTASVEQQKRIEQALQRFAAEMAAAQRRQQATAETLAEVACALEARVNQRNDLQARFAALGESAVHVNTLMKELTEKRAGKATHDEVSAGLREVQLQLAALLAEAAALATAARDQEWPEIERRAGTLRQQFQTLKNRVALAEKSAGGRAPS